MQSDFIHIDSSRFHYLKMGNGKNVWFVFHGFSQDAHTFIPTFRPLEQTHSIILIDLPHHGSTVFEEKYFTSRHIRELFSYFKAQYAFEEVSLFGFSIGGKVVLDYLQSPAFNIRQVVLAASDGFYIDSYYHLATYNPIGKWLFRFFQKYPNRLIKAARVLGRLGILSRVTLRFAEKNIEQPELFGLVGKVWPCFKKIKIDQQKVIDHLNTMQTATLLILGAKDAVIRPGPAEQFTARLDCGKVTSIPFGHNLAYPQAQEKIGQLILQFQEEQHCR